MSKLHILAAASVAAVLLPATSLLSSPAGGAQRLGVAVQEDFAAATARNDFRASGRGKWTVKSGTLRVHGPAVLTLPRARPLAVYRNRISGERWRLRVDAKAVGRRGPRGVMIVFRFRSTRNYDYVLIDSRASRSGVYRRAGGRTVELAPLAFTARPGKWTRVQLRKSGTRLKVYVQRRGGARRLAARAPIRGDARLTAGLATLGGSARFDNLLVRRPVPSASTTPPPPLVEPPPGGRAVAVSTSEQLTSALARSRPGDVITMADGAYTSAGLAASLAVGGKHYVGTFVAETSGTATAPIVLQGSRRAVIDGKPGEDGTDTQYGLYVAGADHFQVRGITVTNVAKGIVLDESDHSVVEGVVVHTIGQEGIHLRAFSSDNLVTGNVVRLTGRTNETFGEGIYVGSASSNWGTYSGGAPDASDWNRIIGNLISQTSAESMDIKEGTTGGLIADNRFDGAGMTGNFADSWIDVKGNEWTVRGNTGVNALEDGFQVHGALTGWGSGNRFVDNRADVRGPGYGFWVQNNVIGNVVSCDNQVTDAGSGFANLSCTP